MPSYVVSGAARGLGFEFINQLSSDSANTVIGLVRDKASTDEKVAKEIGQRANLHILKGDLLDYASLEAAAAETAKITGGAVDVVIANAASNPEWSGLDAVGDLAHDPKALEKDYSEAFNINVIGNIHLYNLFLPLVQKGSVKKIVTLSTGLADVPFIVEYGFDHGGPYAVSKAALNATVAKYHSQYKTEGILFMAISPGFVNTGNMNDYTPEQMQKVGKMAGKFAAYAPHVTGPIQPDESVKAVLGVVEKADIANNGGRMVSHFGNTQWL